MPRMSVPEELLVDPRSLGLPTYNARNLGQHIERPVGYAAGENASGSLPEEAQEDAGGHIHQAGAPGELIAAAKVINRIQDMNHAKKQRGDEQAQAARDTQ